MIKYDNSLCNCNYYSEMNIEVEGACEVVKAKCPLSYTTLLSIYMNGRIDELKDIILIYNIDISTIADGEGDTLLHSIYDNHKDALDILNWLPQTGCKFDINVKNNEGTTPLYATCCITKNNEALVKKLVEMKANVNIQDSQSFTPLHALCFRGNLELIKFLVDEAKANIWMEDLYGRTPIFIAIRKGYLDVVTFLIETDDQMENSVTNDGQLLSHYAALYGQLHILKYLVVKRGWGIKIDETDGNYHSTLYYAATYGHLDTVKYLVEECDAKVDGITIYQYPIYGAVKRGHSEIVKYLYKNYKEQMKLTKEHIDVLGDIAKANNNQTIREYIAIFMRPIDEK